MTIFTLGGILQMVGVVIVAWGAIRTWREFAPDEPIAKPVLDAVRASLAALRARLRRLLDRLLRTPAQHITGSGSIVAPSATVNARETVGYTPLPAGTDVAEAIRQLDQRTIDISNQLSAAEGQLGDKAEAIRQQVARLSEMLDAHVVRLDAKGRRVATGGVRASLVGGALVFLGIGLQTFA